MNAPSLAFGPVPSRRLGQSLGVNHIPPKHCSYDCVYCQVGRTMRTEVDRQAFHAPADLREAVVARLEAERRCGRRVDFVTFVPDGEPTLDLTLAASIEAVRPLGIPVAVLTNGSLLADPAVREALRGADLVSVKVDAVREATWRRVNRPDPSLSMAEVLYGIRAFAEGYEGQLLTETMLVAGVNDRLDDLRATAAFVGRLQPQVAWIGVPTRPPSEPWVHAPDPDTLVAAWELFSAEVDDVGLLLGDAEGEFGHTGDPEQDLLATTSVHPMREAEVRGFLERSGADPALAGRLVAQGRLRRVRHRGQIFYVRRPA